MAHLAKLTVNWSGFPGSPGFTNLYWRNATPGIISQAVVDNAISKTDTWLNVWNSRLPTGVTVLINSAVEIIDDGNGELQDFMTGAPFQRASGSGTGNYSAPSGAVVNWRTNGVKNGRRVRGRSFMVPIAGAALSTNGSIADGDLGVLRTASTAMHAATGDARLVVWSRPVPEKPGPPVVPAVAGGSYEVVAATIPDMAAVLTSRRD